jgi:SET domain-containing protein
MNKKIRPKVEELTKEPVQELTKEQIEINTKRDQIINDWTKRRTEGYSTDHLEIKSDIIKGMGVFAKKDINKGEIVEYCHSMIYDWREKYISDRAIIEYAYRHWCDCKECRTHGGLKITPFGFGSIYNSSETKDTANIMHWIFANHRLIAYEAIKEIKKGEELVSWFGERYYNDFCKPKVDWSNTEEGKKYISNKTGTDTYHGLYAV